MDPRHPATPSIEELEAGVLVMPNGTVSATMDRAAGELRLFCEQDPDDLDWLAGLSIAREHGNGNPPDEYMDQDVVVLVFKVR